MKLSNRMKAVAAMVTNGSRLADIGTDHAFVPIFLLQKQIIPWAIASDINEGPLERAREHIREAGLEEQISIRLGDGLSRVSPGEADSILIAGMGGELILHILEEGEAVCRQAGELILQPQSEIHKVRRYLREHDYRLVDEDMILEDGKYYPMMRAVPVESLDWDKNMSPEAVETCDIYGPMLLKDGNQVLRKYLVREHRINQGLLTRLSRVEETPAIRERKEVLAAKLRCNELAYSLMGEVKNAGL